MPAEKDVKTWAHCPNCGYEVTVTKQGSIAEGKAINMAIPCMGCGMPLAYNEGTPPERKTAAVEQDFQGGVIDIGRLTSVARADAEGTRDPVAKAVSSTLEALEALGVIPKGAVER